MQRSFCSWSCWRSSLGSALYSLLKPPLTTPGILNKFRGYLAEKNADLFSFFFFVAVITVSALVIFSVFQKALIEKQQQALPIDSADSTEFYAEMAPFEAQVTSSTIHISGEAADSVIISLKVNDKITAVCLPANGQFLFENVRLDYGDNDIKVFALTTDGQVRVLQRMTTRYGAPVPAFLARNIMRGEIMRKQIALTFDGGSGNACAEEILDILKQKKMRCTMFLTGGFIKRYPQLVARIAQEGHEIGNHTWSHPHLTTYTEDQQQNTRAGITRERLQQELTRTADLFFKMTGRKMAPLWRAPFGEQNADIRRWAAEIGYLQIGWTTGSGQTMDTLDWVVDTTSTIYHSTDEILQRLLQFGKNNAGGANGGIVLMHLDTQRKDPAYRILPALIDSLNSRGYTFATVSDIIRP